MVLDRIQAKWPLATCHEVDWSDGEGPYHEPGASRRSGPTMDLGDERR